MPTYEYSCSKCGHEYEKREGFDAPSTQRCPKCRGSARRVLHAAPIVFKGSGFYVTDSRKPPTDGESASGAQAEANDTKKEKSESKEKSDSGGRDTEPAAAG